MLTELEYRERFWAKVNKTDACWEWTGAKNWAGYGAFRYMDKRVTASRIAWQFCVGPIPIGIGVLHRCDNPSCVRPEHLFLGTHKENMADCISKGRFHMVDYEAIKPKIRGENSCHHKLTEKQVIEILSTPRIRGYQSALVKRYGVSQGTISDVIARKSWSHVIVPTGQA